MFGKLSLDAFPIHEPIIVAAFIGVVVLGTLLLGLITYYGKWKYLWTEWFTTVDHKKIGVMYVIVALVMMVRGFTDAMMMRTQLAMAQGGNEGFLNAHHYDQVFTAHGVIMILFMAMPLMTGLMNLVVPLQIGARDVAFPLLNAVSFWLFVAGALLLNLSLFVGEYATTGWLGYPPLSGLALSPGVGVDYWAWSLQIAGLGTLLTGVNFFVTIIKMRAPGMTLMKMPAFVWTILCTNILILASFPVLTVTLALLSLDRYFGMHFFTNDLGGNQMLYVNLIWIWGHPEVYILALPAFGIFSEVVATFSRKKLFGYTSLVWATGVITILSFVVWLHHFFTMGAGANVNAFFGIATMIISIPTGLKIFNWLFTMYGGRVQFTAPIIWTIGFLVTFSIGGMTGVLLAVPGANFVLHNSLFLIAHFHNVIIGSVVFGYLAGFAYWFPKAFGFKLNDKIGKASSLCWIVGFFVAFMPLYVLGFMGMTRRLSNYDNPEWQPLLIVAFFGMLIIAAGIALQFVQLYVSVRNKKKNLDVTGDPWDGRTLEWSTSSPPPFYNFAIIPDVTHYSRDAFWDMKESGALDKQPIKYQDIHMPKNTAVGVWLGIFSLVFGFALIWHIWWLAIVGLAALVVTLIARSFDNDIDYYVPAAEVERIENLHIAAKAKFKQEMKHV